MDEIKACVRIALPNCWIPGSTDFIGTQIVQWDIPRETVQTVYDAVVDTLLTIGWHGRVIMTYYIDDCNGNEYGLTKEQMMDYQPINCNQS